MSEAAEVLTGSEATPEPGLANERRAVVERARKAWMSQLIDQSRRNNLLYFRELQAGTLDLSGADPEALAALLGRELAESSVPISRLLPGEESARLPVVLREIHRRAQANLEEKGLQTLFLALGMATWPASDDGRDPEAPVLLVPVTVEWRGRDGRAAALRRAGDPQVNLVLLHALEVEHGCRLAPETLLAALEVSRDEEAAGEPGEPAGPEPTRVYEQLTMAARGVRGFEVRERAVLGNFSFQKMAMVKDLQELGEALAAHEVIAAIAGDAGAAAAVRGSRREIDRKALDAATPEEEFLVLDADASQQAAIAAARDGEQMVIQGPPGTGKSQTITNLIATLTAHGRRVLFVAEKRAALEVVLERLRDAGLEHLALDLHGADISRRSVMDRLRTSLQRVRDALPVEEDGLHHRFVEQRARLNEHATRMHAPRPPAGKSVFELKGRLLRQLVESAATRWRGAELARLDAAAAGAIMGLLREAAGFARLFTRDDPSPWTGAELTNGAAVQEATDAVVRLVTTHWPRLEVVLRHLVASLEVRPPETVAETRAMVALLEEVSGTLERYAGELFREEMGSLKAALEPASRGTWAHAWAMLSDGRYRQAGKTVRALRRERAVGPEQLLAEVTAAAEQAERWRALFGDAPLPQAPVEMGEARQALAAVDAALEVLERCLEPGRLDWLPLPELVELLGRLMADGTTPHRIPRLLQIEREIEAQGAGAIIGEIRVRKPAPEGWPAFFESAWLASCFDQARVDDPQIGGFNGRAHDGVVEEFRELDRERLRLAAARVRRAHAESVIRTMNEHPDQEALLKRETEKRARHMPLRELLAKAPDVLTALSPCWMASPLSVSQLLPGDRHYFDVVIFDEASQVLPHDAVPALLRAEQAVVAGDEHQLSPTLFFADGGGESEEDGAPTSGFESLLQLMRSVAGDVRPLQWHYRSRDESLIVFSNQQIYQPDGQEMITFPGPGDQSAVTHVLVEGAAGGDGDEESGAEEVRRVVELVLQHAEQRPEETLGVIAMGIKHASRIQAALDDALRARPELEAFFDDGRHERFFVKNLERVQGDERDAILLSIGYGKDRSGKLPYRFGPLNQEGGHRRLNVAVTRARRRMTVVSSFSHHDMEPGRSKAKGVELLRLYLQFAARGGERPGETTPVETVLTGFEADIHEALTARGIPLLPRWGASRYGIDLVAQHPDRPGRFVLAIECDGASYAEAPTARDRDRLRPQHLGALGWRYHRIWSTDWFMRRDEEIERAWAAFQDAVEAADRDDDDPGTDRGGTLEEELETLETWAQPVAREALERGHRPLVGRREAITQYHRSELRALVQWIQSDGRLRTDDELIAEMVRELGFQKRGARIEARCREVLEQLRAG
jgi:hypothetical protein